MADQDPPVAVWIDDCGRSFVTADEYATALEERDDARRERDIARDAAEYWQGVAIASDEEDR